MNCRIHDLPGNGDLAVLSRLILLLSLDGLGVNVGSIFLSPSFASGRVDGSISSMANGRNGFRLLGHPLQVNPCFLQHVVCPGQVSENEVLHTSFNMVSTLHTVLLLSQLGSEYLDFFSY